MGSNRSYHHSAAWQGLITLSGVFAKPRFDPIYEALNVSGGEEMH